ncbi:polyamine aminopropyltransferase [Achromobacter xylosoxidans]|uniref:Polyamine aminopropyltransferase n=1 Tax=Alcaligenes xylosoxydans xylosoxydans TaxID=85698 RepID=A0A1R1JW92_ALCXX|nr:polyamine aminopropyltransferase [Achromobacter xylosoxidans]OMG90066.1 spermidine synthase [Achromobacter xylosoxidans]BEG75359.1 Polyamine aminopropyltransferase [Achromobacter xylosoxidans]
MRDRVLILSVLIVASCGLGYELISSALASYLLGDSILQFSSVIGCYLFAMGIGSWLSKYVKDDDVLNRFIDVELAVALLGGVSAAVLFLVFAWLSAPFRAALYAGVFIIGLMVGMEIPLVMRVFNQRKAEFREIVSRVLTFDYLGALAVSLIFPLLLAPKLGLLRTSFLFGMLNAGVALWTTWLFRGEIRRPAERAVRGGVVLGLLALGFLFSGQMTAWAEKGLYGDDVVHAETTPYQRLIVTRWHDDLRLYINGNLQFSSRDEHRYHESLVIPGLQALPWARNVLVLGGGDGLAVREILKYKHVEHVTLVDLDPAMTGLFSRSEPLTKLNQGSLTDPRVTVINDDAGRWLESHAEVYDFIVVDFPDPSNFGLGRLYSVPVYHLMARHLAENGYMVIQSTSPYFAPRSFWSVDATLKEAGLNTWPYHAYVPSFGDWGFILAGKRRDYAPPTAVSVPTRYLDPATLRELFHFPADMPALAMPPNRLNEQSLVRYFDEDWRKVIR